MARVTTEAFEKRVRRVCKNSANVVRITLLGESLRHIQLRIFLRDRTFIDIYYNQDNEKTAFAQIHNDMRIFGADNTNGVWHWHPREDPASHVLAESDISFEEFMARLVSDLE